MAASIDGFNVMWFRALVNREKGILLNLVVDDYIRKDDEDEIQGKDAFSKLIDEWFEKHYFKRYNYQNSYLQLNDDEYLCHGTGKTFYTESDSGCDDLQEWKASWSDIRIKCPDGLWRLKATITTEN